MITNADREDGVEVSRDLARSTFAAERPANEASAAPTPEPYFCQREACRGLARCPKDPVCND